MKTVAMAILLAVISTSGRAAEPAPLSAAEAKYVAEYEQLSQAIDRVCAIWARDLHNPEKLLSSDRLLQALIEIRVKHENDLDLACGATYDEAMRQRELDAR